MLNFQNKRIRRKKTFSTIFSSSMRLTLIYIVLFVWVGMAIFALFIKADLYALAVYFTSGLPLILGYLWAQTSRPSITDAAELVKGINMRPQQNQSYGTYGGSFMDQGYMNNQNLTQIQTVQLSQPEVPTSIYSDDATIELKISQSQLSTLLNLGYVNMNNNKYLFKVSLTEQIKSLIGENIQDPLI